MDPIKVGFAETKQAIDLAIALGKGIEKSLTDKKLDFADVPNFIPAFMVLFAAIQGAEDIPMEFSVASKEETDELKKYVQDNLDLEDDKVEGFIEDAFKVLLDIFMVYKLYFAPVPQEPIADKPTTDATITE